MFEHKNDFNDLFYRPPNFCIDCGDLLDFEIINNNNVKCQKCGGETSLDNIKNHVIETEEKYEFSKIWVNKLKNKEDKLRTEQKNERTIINEKCPKCNYNQMYYYTIQTRGADEGSTVYYECVKCHYKFNQNN
jgi:DNA-directed RNA polymerase I subunit RPA12